MCGTFAQGFFTRGKHVTNPIPLCDVILIKSSTAVNFINILRACFFVQNFGAKNYKAVFWV